MSAISHADAGRGGGDFDKSVFHRQFPSLLYGFYSTFEATAAQGGAADDTFLIIITDTHEIYKCFDDFFGNLGKKKAAAAALLKNSYW